MPFSDHFLWGAACADYQVEGAYNEDGKGLGIWDALSEGKIKHAETGNVACDHYHRWQEDVALLKKLGVKVYRFGVSWSRIIPQPGVVNQKGLQFYRELVSALVEAGIEPMCTLYHWNLPMWSYEKGGWHNESIVDDFAEFARVVVDALSDHVRYWITINEPATFITLGYLMGSHAPYEAHMNHPEEQAEVLPLLSRHVLLAHGRAVQVIRQQAVLPPVIGFAFNSGNYIPLENTPEAIESARKATLSDEGPFSTGWWADPILTNTVPEPLKAVLSPADLEIIRQPLDFYGLNCYNAANFEVYGGGVKPPVGMPRTALGWPITPDVLYWTSKFLYEKYHLPVLITENGMANLDFIMSDGKVHDPQRIEFMRGYLKGLRRAAEEGIPVIGYTAWSIMDNFEWAEGYDPRFGLIYIDYQTQKRTPKDSFYWYSDVIRTNGKTL